MTPERISELRAQATANARREQTMGSVCWVPSSAMVECLDEIERLRRAAKSGRACALILNAIDAVEIDHSDSIFRSEAVSAAIDAALGAVRDIEADAARLARVLLDLERDDVITLGDDTLDLARRYVP
mgnify:CR=1 FL=1